MGDAGDERQRSSLRAMAHPLRLRMLSLLTGAELSASEVARELEITQANASYHLRALVKAGYLIEAGTQKVRGGVAKKYRYIAGEMPADRRRHEPTEADFELWLAAHQAELRRRLLERSAAIFDADAEVWLDPGDWERARELVQQASLLVHQQAKPPRSEGTKRVNFMAILFEMTS
ncbi:ArsR family transcriptional regulator [Branchiibius hedensis]|uniref:Helix-turn-helix domain-containing protein n=1 Tax=Branchiibius hedensis TaxID=672460 RepID=A0A2Y9BUS2_9MICO|nr:ArsR family transcriptional regulator [Branchiibius hedensis]SSA36192.1 Helix-turn-helix domain-containing protein [Branchiibius hedensis]